MASPVYIVLEMRSMDASEPPLDNWVCHGSSQDRRLGRVVVTHIRISHTAHIQRVKMRPGHRENVSYRIDTLYNINLSCF